MRNDIAIKDRSPIGVHRTVARRTTSRTDAEQFGAFFDQGNASSGARSAEHRETLPNRPTAPRYHFAPFRIGVDCDYTNLTLIGLQLIGHDAGERGADMLAHLGPGDVNSHLSAGIDAIPDGRFEQFARAACRLIGEAFPSIPQHDASPYHADQETAARRVGGGPESMS